MDPFTFLRLISTPADRSLLFYSSQCFVVEAFLKSFILAPKYKWLSLHFYIPDIVMWFM